MDPHLCVGIDVMWAARPTNLASQTLTVQS